MTIPRARKDMTLMVLEHTLMVDYFQKRRTINGTYYASLLKQLLENFKLKSRGKLSKDVLFYQINDPVHKSVFAINDCGFVMIGHLH
jgi:hypothetical protein